MFRYHDRDSRWKRWLVGGSAIFCLTLALLWFPLGDFFAQLSYDLPFLSRDNVSDTNVVVLVEDRATLVALGHTNFPPKRTVHAQLVDKLREEGATLVVFDISFRDPKPDEDGVFAEAIRRHGRVILGGVAETATHQVGHSAGARVVEVKPPTDVLRNAAADWALLLLVDPDATLGGRRLLAQWKDYTTVPWLAAQYNNVLGDNESPQTERWINFYGASPALDQVTLGEVLEIGERTLPLGCLRGKVVFVGFDSSVTPASGRRDVFATPFTRVGKDPTPGVEIFANVYANLANRDWLRQVSLPIQGLLALLFGAAALAALLYSGQRWMLLVASLLLIALAFASISLQTEFHYWWNWCALAFVQLPFTVFWVWLYPRPPIVAFISYRRDGGREFVTALRAAMLLRHKDTLSDAELKSGNFPSQIRAMIDKVPNVIVVLSKNALDKRIADPEDWLRIEIAYSMAKGKHLIPVLIGGFDFKKVTKVTSLPKDIEGLPLYNSVIYHGDDFKATLDRIEKELI